MKSPVQIYCIALLFVALAWLSPCYAAVNLQAPRPAAPPPPESNPFASLTPVKSGPGVLVCLPIARKSDPDTTAFGNGCALWLRMMVQGQGEFGKTVDWTVDPTDYHETHWPSLQLTSVQASDMVHAIGLTHAVTGEITGNAAHFTLTLQLWSLSPTAKTVGLPIRLQGNENAIVSQLPKAAIAICNRLGLAKPRVPNTVGSSPQELVTLAHVPSDVTVSLPIALQAQLQEIGLHQPLAGLLALHGSYHSKNEIAALMRQASDNPVVVMMIAEYNAHQLQPYAEPIQTLIKRFPNNYQVDMLRMYLASDRSNVVDERAALEHAVRVSPSNPIPWIFLGQTMSYQADEIQNQPYDAKKEYSNSEAMTHLRQLWLTAVQRAAKLDPNNSAAWFDTSRAAAFNNDTDLSENAFWHAFKAKPNDPELYRWGFREFQPFWRLSETKSLKLVRLALDHGMADQVGTEMLTALEGVGTPHATIETLRLRILGAMLTHGSEQSITLTPGIVICEPTGDLANAFGSAAGRWLQLMVGAQGELGQTPEWSSIEQTRHELGFTDLRLTRDQGIALGQQLGVTHVAIGTISGSAEQMHLSYHILTIGAKSTEDGQTYDVTGSQTEMIAALPKLARQMANQLGASDPKIPDSVGLSPDDFAFLGSVPRVSEGKSQPPDADRLAKLAETVPLAGMIALMDTESSTPPRQQVSDNPIVLAHLGRLFPRALIPLASVIADNVKRYPNNYLWNTINGDLQRTEMNIDANLQARWRAVRCHPKSAAAWFYLDGALKFADSTVREGRIWAKMSPFEQDAELRDVALSRVAVDMALKIDAKDGNIWLAKAKALTFSGDITTATEDFWKARELAPNDFQINWWGLQMFQPKWGGQPNDLRKLCHILAADTTLFPQFAMNIADAMVTMQDPNTDDKALLDKAKAQIDENVRTNPPDILIQEYLADYFYFHRDVERGVNAYKRWIELDPDNPDAHYAFARFCFYYSLPDQAMPEYLAAFTLCPNYAEARFNYANMLYNHKNYTEAIEQYQRVIELKPLRTEVHCYQGNLLAYLGRRPEAIAEWQKEVELDPTNVGKGDAARQLLSNE